MVAKPDGLVKRRLPALVLPPQHGLPLVAGVSLLNKEGGHFSVPGPSSTVQWRIFVAVARDQQLSGLAADGPGHLQVP
uniref:Uncharacterized protein n=1 Tax=Arundo donax TaxID=35708 RepID=A0A0A9HLA8_ARUDO